MPSVPSAVTRFQAEIAAELRASFPSTSDVGPGETSAPGLYNMIRYHFGWLDLHFQPLAAPAGKALRPTLCLLAAEAVGGDYHQALPAAAALELLHNFSLIHDDIQDRGDERHHRPTVWRVWGEAQGIDAGDAALVLAELAMIREGDRGAAPAMIITGLRQLNLACLRLAEGQHLDISFAGRLSVSADEYYQMIDGKTAALLGCSLELGALFGAGDEQLADRYRRVGETLGLAFQVQDDLLGIWGKPERTGKPGAADVFERKMTLPVIHALGSLDPLERAELSAIYSGDSVSPAQAERAAALIEGSGAHQAMDARVREHYACALADLAALAPAEPAGGQLREIAAFLVDRDY